MEAASGWHQTYTAHGREITVDIDVPVPATDKLPVQKVEFMRLSLATTKVDATWSVFCRENENVFGFSTPTFPEGISGKIIKSVDDVYAYPDEPDKIYPAGGTLTLGEALAVVRHTFELTGIDPNAFLIDRPYLLRTFSYLDAKTNESVLPGEYYFSFHQALDGIPILCHSGIAFKERYKLYYDPGFISCVAEENAYLALFSMVKATDIVAEDIPLCSFSQVISAIEKEIDNGHIRKVYDLELGYVMYEDEDYYEGRSLYRTLLCRTGMAAQLPLRERCASRATGSRRRRCV